MVVKDGKMSQSLKYLQVIHNIYPHLPLSEAAIEFIGAGQYNDVLAINWEYIFRFPKYLEALKQLKLETQLLLNLHNRLPLETPYPQFVNLQEAPVGQAFIGYRRIKGEPFWRETYQAIESEEVRNQIALQTAAFLWELHTIPLTSLACELPRLDTYEENMDLYARIRDKLFPHMRREACAWASRHFESFLGQESNFGYVPVLKHGDFGPGNILFDWQDRKLVGVIDFSGAGMGDPAYDFAGLLSGYGENFVRLCANFYPDLDQFYDRVLYYQGTFALVEALFGIENNDLEAFEDGIGMYR